MQALFKSLYWLPVWLAQIMLHGLRGQVSEGLLTFRGRGNLRLRGLGLLSLLSRVLLLLLLLLLLDLLNCLLSLRQFLLEDLDDVLRVSLGRVALHEGCLERSRLSQTEADGR